MRVQAICGHRSAGLLAKAAQPASFSRPRAALVAQRRNLRIRAEAGADIENPESEAARKKAEAERLRAAEKFLVIGTGEAECTSCGYTYVPSKGDPDYPISPGVTFQKLPEDWQCPVCGAEKKVFVVKQREVAGFAENQGYGLGTNSMTGEQKSLLIFGSLAALFFLLLLGYTMN